MSRKQNLHKHFNSFKKVFPIIGFEPGNVKICIKAEEKKALFSTFCRNAPRN